MPVAEDFCSMNSVRDGFEMDAKDSGVCGGKSGVEALG